MYGCYNLVECLIVFSVIVCIIGCLFVNCLTSLFITRLLNVGILSKQVIIYFGLSGVLMRAAAVVGSA